jgi:diguanylate cyclase (GGDEF)-like protein/PAS domain S-box-containing protein/hemerythrin-like metal-binding protein
MRRVFGILALFIFGLFGAWFWQWRGREQTAAEAVVLKERLRADVLQMEGEKRFRTVFEHTALPMVRNSLQGEFIEVNDAWCEMFGYSREEALSRHLTWRQITHPDDLEKDAVLVGKLLAGETEDIRIEKSFIRKDGKVLWGSLQVSLVRDEQGVPQYFISAIQDITERKRAEQQISFMAYHDKLTGLPNRALLFDRLSQAMSQAKRDTKHVALLFADLDGFKTVNDEHGHEAGDAVLRMAAQRFLACVRAVDTVARTGGDEFAIVLGGLEDPQQAKAVAEKIVQAFAQSLTLPDGGDCHVGASVGISIYPEHGSAMDHLMVAADRAMYDSKRSGKNSYTFFKQETPDKDDVPWIKFENSHLVGVEEIDEQHRNLVYLVNRLNDALKHDDSPEVIMRMFDDLLVATTHHFDTEGRYMKEQHYPRLDEHESEHAHLVNEVVHFKEQFSQGRELLVLQLIKDWLLNHIIYSDKKLGAYLVQHGVK